MEVINTNFAAFIDVFTSNTYVMVVMSDSAIRKCSQLKFHPLPMYLWILVNNMFYIASAATLINIRNARKHFEKLERASQSSALTR